jgi:internalin A
MPEWTEKTALAEARRRIAACAKTRSDTLNLGRLWLRSLPDELRGLTWLRRLELHRNNIDAKGAKVLAGLTSLTLLNIRRNKIGDHGAKILAKELVALPLLAGLDLSGNRIGAEGAKALATLETLTNLHLRSNNIGTAGAKVLASLKSLTNLNLRDNNIGSQGAEALASLTSLTTLNLADNNIGTKALKALAGLNLLTRLNLSANGISDISPLLALDRLQIIRLSGNQIRTVCPEFWANSSLREAVLYMASLGDVPRELLSLKGNENCLPRLRAYLRDRASGQPETVRDIKVMLLGNGRIGKTQISNRLRGEDFEEDALSTHGVRVHRAELPAPNADGPSTPLHIWDFGGQDIYLGTHALFLRTRAIFPIVWTVQSERRREHTYRGLTFRNFPLEYWVRYVDEMAGSERPIVLVQNQVDGPAHKRVPPKVDHALLDGFYFHQNIAYSAKTQRGQPALIDSLQKAVAHVHETEGLKHIGGGWAVVKRRLEALRADAQAARRGSHAHPALGAISREQFEAMCADPECVAAGGVSEPDVLLDYLHQVGTVFHRPGLFAGRIIVDQQWALEAIYAVFERGSGVYRHIREIRGGRFTRSELTLLLWDGLGHGEPEQGLFLDMMRSCRICFQLRAPERGGEPEYVAPDLLPPRASVQHRLDEGWDEEAPTERAVFPFDLVPPGLLRSLMAEVGEVAGVSAVYWQDGFYFYDAGTRSRAIVEQARADRGFGGRIEVSAQRGDASGLLAVLAHLVKAHQDQLGLATGMLRHAGGFKAWLTRWTTGRRRQELALRRAAERAAELLEDRRGDGLSRDEADATALARHGEGSALVPIAPQALARLSPAPTPLPERAYYVSYAWGNAGPDATPEDRLRETAVDALCERKKREGITIVRDRDVLRFGDSIANFMDQLAQGRRIYVVLSARYLRRPHCMYELFSIWTECRRRAEAFRERVRVIALPDAAIYTLEDRLAIAEHWKKTFESQRQQIAASPELVSPADFAAFKLVGDFAHRTADILSLIAGTLHPRSIEDIDDLSFD